MTGIIISLVVSALLAVFASITAPLILAHRTATMHREDRLADWARQDEIAEAARESAARVDNKLDVIHVLVNSNMTAAMQAELDAIKREIVMMREVVVLNLAAGREPTVEALAAIEATQVKITELESQLADRKTAADAAARLHNPPEES